MLKTTEITREELQRLIDQAVDRKLQELFGEPDMRTLDEVYTSIEHNRWTPPPGSKSTLELLREDRDR